MLSIAVLSLLFAIAGRAASQDKPAEAPKAPASKVNAEEAYRTTCAVCHGPDGNAAIKEMNFADGEWKHGSSTSDIAKTISDGVPGTAMLSFKDKFSKEEILALAKLVRSFDKTKTTKKGPAKKKTNAPL